MSWGGGGSLITMPTTPYPAKLEMGKAQLAAAKTNPFTGSQQIQNWNNSFRMGSCVMPPLDSTDGAAWAYFMDELDGIVNVFQFMSTLCTDSRYCWFLTSDGTTTGTPKYFRLNKNDYTMTMSAGGIYRLSFEFREAI